MSEKTFILFPFRVCYRQVASLSKVEDQPMQGSISWVIVGEWSMVLGHLALRCLTADGAMLLQERAEWKRVGGTGRRIVPSRRGAWVLYRLHGNSLDVLSNYHLVLPHAPPSPPPCRSDCRSPPSHSPSFRRNSRRSTRRKEDTKRWSLPAGF